jgi:regulatory protein
MARPRNAAREQEHSAPPEQERALALAHRELARRERTIAEVRTVLDRRGVGEQAIAGALTELTELGLLDDARYARLFTEDRRALDGWGSERIARALAQRGVASELIKQALAGAGEADTCELDRALAVLARRFPAQLAEPSERQRAFAMLVRKGYDSELAGDAVRRYGRES